jgi:hypothetical protein
MAEKLTRKEFLILTTKCAACATVGVAGVSLIGREGEARDDLPPWPWPYKKLDPELIFRRVGIGRAIGSESDIP